MMTHIAGLFHHLGHQHPVKHWIPRTQRSKRGRELVAQHEDEVARHSGQTS